MPMEDRQSKNFYAFSVMKKGDLVKVVTHNSAPGALTAIKFLARLDKDVGGKVGIVLSDVTEDNPNLIIQFSNCKKIIHRRFLTLVG